MKNFKLILEKQDLYSKLSTYHIDIKKKILDKIEYTNDKDLQDIINLNKSTVKSNIALSIPNLNTEETVLDFYKDNKESIDLILNDNEVLWFNEIPSKHEIRSVQKYIYKSTEYAINYVMELIEDDLF